MCIPIKSPHLEKGILSVISFDFSLSYFCSFFIKVDGKAISQLKLQNLKNKNTNLIYNLLKTKITEIFK